MIKNSILKSIFFITILVILCTIFSGCSLQLKNKSQVQLSSICGNTLSELPQGTNDPRSLSTGSFNVMSLSAHVQQTNIAFLSHEDRYSKPSHHEDVFSTKANISSIPQTVVLFDIDQYASITIQLDNPYEYYICDFYMVCSQSDAMIWVDDEWIPLDGSVKIRWTGTTNRKAEYAVFMPTVDTDTTITIREMRYLNEKEIDVDLAEREVANVYRIESPVRTQFVVNTPEFFLFDVIQNENCVSVDVENAVYSQKEKAYQMTENGVFKVKFEYKIPGTELVGEGELVSEEIELLTVYIQPQPFELPFYSHDFSSDQWSIHCGTTCHFGAINFMGTGISFHIADLNDDVEKHFPSRYFGDHSFTVSINGGKFAEAIVVESNANGSDRYGWLYIKLDSPPYDAHTFAVKWNGYIIYSGECTNFW